MALSTIYVSYHYLQYFYINLQCYYIYCTIATSFATQVWQMIDNLYFHVLTAFSTRLQCYSISHYNKFFQTTTFIANGTYVMIATILNAVTIVMSLRMLFKVYIMIPSNVFTTWSKLRAHKI